jgi:hypothetical protein
LFNRAHEEGIDPASIPEYAEATNPLRQKLREREKLQGDLENIKLATAMENLGDTVVVPKTKQRMLGDIPYEQRQFFPSVTKAADDEKLFAVTTKSLLNDMGYKKLGEDLLSDILEGKAGDTSKLTIENYIRDKHLSRVEAEKAAKLQQQQYRTALETALTDRIKNDQNVQTFGNAAIITLDKNTPKDVAIRDMSADTTILDHCVGQCGTAPKGRKNILTNQQQYYEPVVDPITGARNRSEEGRGSTSYVEDLERGHELVSVRDVKTGFPAATIQLTPTSRSSELSNGMFNIGYASGAKNGAVDPAYVGAIRDYLNSRAASINSPGDNLADNVGIFDSRNPSDWKRVTKEAKLSKDQAAALEAETDRFVTVDDVKEMSKKYPTQEPSPSGEPSSTELGDWEVDNAHGANNRGFVAANVANDLFYTDVAVDGTVNRPAIEDTIFGLRNGQIDHQAFRDLPEQNRRTGMNLVADVMQAMINQNENLAANVAPAPAADRFALALRYDLPPITVEELQARFRDPQVTVADLGMLRESARTRAPGTIFETLPPEARDGAANLIGDEIRRRALAENARAGFNRNEDLFPAAQAAERRQGALAEPVQPAAQLAVRAQVPREIQVMAPQDLIAQMEPQGIRQARELARQYFDENIIDDNNTTIGALTDMVRSYAVGPHADAMFDVRELAARELEALNNDAIMDADQIAETLREAMYNDMTPEEAMRQADRDVSTLLRHGEAAWEDLIGPLAEDIPWSRNLQARVIENLRIIADQFREMRDEGHAKGGMVKKKRKANKAGTPSVVNMRYPELAEMQYRYGGMV